MSLLRRAPQGRDAIPSFDGGWVLDSDSRTAYLSYVEAPRVNWSDELEGLHEDSSRRHFLDVWTRAAILARLDGLPSDGTVVDVGCSTGYLLEDIHAALPDATLIGVDLVSSGLRKAHDLVPNARLLQADVCDLPLADAVADAVVSANLLEHVPDDCRALMEIARILRPSGRAVLVVPAAPSTYDYYDRFLGHERRYARGELAERAGSAGLTVVEDRHLASLLFPAFWLVKQRNRLRFARLEGASLEDRVARDIAATKDSRVGRTLRRVEERLDLRLPFGIRNLVVLAKGHP